jgi:hypothetical protein
VSILIAIFVIGACIVAFGALFHAGASTHSGLGDAIDQGVATATKGSK